MIVLIVPIDLFNRWGFRMESIKFAIHFNYR